MVQINRKTCRYRWYAALSDKLIEQVRFDVLHIYHTCGYCTCNSDICKATAILMIPDMCKTSFTHGLSAGMAVGSVIQCFSIYPTCETSCLGHQRKQLLIKETTNSMSPKIFWSYLHIAWVGWYVCNTTQCLGIYIWLSLSGQFGWIDQCEFAFGHFKPSGF